MISKKYFIKPGDIVTFEDRKKANLSNVHVTTNIDVLVSQVNDDHVLVGHTKSSIPFDKIKYINGMTPSRILYTASVAIDMDGVLVDFDKGVMDTFGLDLTDVNKSSSELTEEQKEHKNKLYRKLAKVDASWWENLPPMEGAHDLYNHLRDNFSAFFILTAHTKSGKDACVEGKKLWLKKNLRLLTTSENFICCQSKDKQNYIKHKESEFSVLVDDRESNINNWRNAGGIAIHHESTQKTLDILKKV